MPLTKEPLDRGALGREITILANAGVDQLDSRAASRPPIAQARRIGITGAPGAGKSTLVGHLAMHRSQGRRYGILAIDPTSPKSGGAILGDRIRIDELQGSVELFIRSLGSRSALDGLTDNLPEILDAMDCHQFDEVILETVGVGQAEYAVRALVDTVVLVLQPDTGDAIQAMKAGIMEMADVFVVNKADLPGSARTASDIARIVGLQRVAAGEWARPVVRVSAQDPQSIAALSDVLDQHATWLASSGRNEENRRERARYILKRIAERRIGRVIATLADETLDRSTDEQWAEVLNVLDAWKHRG